MTAQNPPPFFSEFVGIPEDLIPLLQRAQNLEGYVSPERIDDIARFLKISPNQVYGVASFYTQFRFTPPGRHSIRICLGTACHVQGGQSLSDSLERELGIAPGQTTPDGRFDFVQVACLGCCALAPVMQVDEDIYSRVTPNRIQEILKTYA